MANNITLPGTGQVVGTFEKDGVDYQVVILADALGTSINPVTKELIETLQDLIQRLTPLAGAVTNVGGQSLVVSQRSVPSTAVTGSVTATGGGYITSAQSIGEKTVGGISYTQRVAQENMSAVLSNINNAIMK